MTRRQPYAAVWDIPDDTATLHVLAERHAADLAAMIDRAELLPVGSPTWALIPEGSEPAARAAEAARLLGIDMTSARFPDFLTTVTNEPLLLAVAPVVAPMPPARFNPMPAVAETVRQLNTCGWDSDRIAAHMHIPSSKVDAVRAACKISYPIGADGL